MDRIVLNYIQLLKNETVIPGHGPIGGRPTIIAMKHYLLDLKEHVLQQLKDKKSLEETQNAVEPILRKKYKDWKQLDWIRGNIERAWLEYSFERKDLSSACYYSLIIPFFFQYSRRECFASISVSRYVWFAGIIGIT